MDTETLKKANALEKKLNQKKAFFEKLQNFMNSVTSRRFHLGKVILVEAGGEQLEITEDEIDLDVINLNNIRELAESNVKHYEEEFENLQPPKTK